MIFVFDKHIDMEWYYKNHKNQDVKIYFFADFILSKRKVLFII